MRKLGAVLVLLLLAVPATQAGQEPLNGNWKITFFDRGTLLNFWLLKVEAKGGKLSGTVATVDNGPQVTLHDLTAKDGEVKFVLKLKDMPIAFTCKLPKGETKKLRGTMSFQSITLPVQLEATKDDNLKDVKPQVSVPEPKGDFKELKEIVVKQKDDLSVFETAEFMVRQAAIAKASLADLKEALAPALKAAADYGDAWLQDIQFNMARRLAKVETYAEYGEELARQALKSAGPGASADLQMRGYAIVASSLEKQGKKAAAAKVLETIASLEVKGYEENEKVGLGFNPPKFAGRKGNKVVLVELFTGAQCPPCVAADLAFEGLGHSFTAGEVVLLQYHLHIPGPDPMTNKDAEARQEYYKKDVRGTPSIFFNGKSEAGGGGPKGAAESKYKQYRDVIDPLLDGETKVKLSAEAKRTGDDVAITATASGYKAGDKLKLRFALVEPWVRYAGNNGLAYHAHVVRALPGGAEGFTLSKDSAKETAKANLAEIRQKASKDLEEFENLDGQRPFSYRNLSLVAFIQDDETKEVLAAVEVPVK